MSEFSIAEIVLPVAVSVMASAAVWLLTMALKNVRAWNRAAERSEEQDKLLIRASKSLEDNSRLVNKMLALFNQNSVDIAELKKRTQRLESEWYGDST